jgi:hypothetical protein
MEIIMAGRNQEYEDTVDEQGSARLEYFVVELQTELDSIERTLDSESSKMLLNWVRDKIRTLHADFNSGR